MEDRPDGFPAGRGNAAQDHGGLVLQGQLRGELGIHGHIRLRVIDHALDLSAQQTAGGVDLFDRHQHDLVHRNTGKINKAGQVMQSPNQYLITRLSNKWHHWQGTGCSDGSCALKHRTSRNIPRHS